MNAQQKNDTSPQMNSPVAPRIRARLGALALILSIAVTGCATNSPANHQYLMQGQVLSVTGDSLVVCIGEQGGAKVGDELSIVRHVILPSGSGKMPGPGFRRDPIGTARINSIFDEHYSRADVLSGNPQVNDTVEMGR